MVQVKSSILQPTFSRHRFCVLQSILVRIKSADRPLAINYISGCRTIRTILYLGTVPPLLKDDKDTHTTKTRCRPNGTKLLARHLANMRFQWSVTDDDRRRQTQKSISSLAPTLYVGGPVINEVRDFRN